MSKPEMYNVLKRIDEALTKCIDMANRKFNVNLDNVEVTFRKRGLSGAMAWRKGILYGNRYGIEFNTQLLESDDSIDHIINEVIPHEVAHLVCFLNPSYGKNHNRGWKNVCIMLGGSGSRTAEMKLNRTRKSRSYIYEVNGKSIQVGSIRHGRIQRGTKSYQVVGLGLITPDAYTGKSIILE